MRFLLDTNTLSYAYRREGACLKQLMRQRDEDVAISSIVHHELAFGMELAPNPRPLHIFLEQLQRRYATLAFDLAAAQAAAQLRAELRQNGQSIGPLDSLIAGTALTHDLILVTHNTREFQRVKTLKLDDWYD